MISARVVLVALALFAGTDALVPLACTRRGFPTQPLSRMMSVGSDLDGLGLSQLKSLAGELGIVDPPGHKGRKKTWIDAIQSKKAPPPSEETVKSAMPVDDDSMSGVTGYFEKFQNQLGLFKSITQPGSPAESYFTALGVSPAPAPSLDDGITATDTDQVDLLVKVMDFLQSRLVGTGDLEGDPEEDPDFIAEGRKILAVSRFALAKEESEVFLLEMVWTEIAALALAGDADAGTMIMMPGYSSGDVKGLLRDKIIPALALLGIEDDVALDGFRMAEGAPCPMIRILYRVDTEAVPQPLEEESYEPIGGDLGQQLQAEAAHRSVEDAVVEAEAAVEVEEKEEVATAVDEEKKEEETESKSAAADEKPKDINDLLLNKIPAATLNKVFGRK